MSETGELWGSRATDGVAGDPEPVYGLDWITRVTLILMVLSFVVLPVAMVYSLDHML